MRAAVVEEKEAKQEAKKPAADPTAVDPDRTALCSAMLDLDEVNPLTIQLFRAA